MKFFFDLFPIILFFIAYKLYGIFTATAVAIAATLVQIIWAYLRHRKVDAMLWVSMAIIAVFGGATLLLHDETFIKWKPTVLYWVFALVLLASAVLFNKNLIRLMLQQQISLPEQIWQRLNISWVAFFALMGLVNLYVAYNFPTDIWVNFKLFGTLLIMLAFVLLQGMVLSRYMEDKEPK